MKKKSISDNKKPRGRPRTGIGLLIGTRWQPDDLDALDSWRREQPDPPTRPEAIRRIVREKLGV